MTLATPSVQPAPPRLEVRRLTKSFPGVKALREVSLTVAPGEVLAVVGENGAGKSTLMKILAGVQTADAGEILLEGSPVKMHSVREALDLGIALIHQELNLADNLDVAANIWLGREPHRRGFIDVQRASDQARLLMSQVGLTCDPLTPVHQLSIGHQQMVEIAKALSINARVLIMDEPTSSLSQKECDHLFRVIRDLRRRGVSIIYISHRLGEVGELADRVCVLRDGRNAGEVGREEITHDRMVSLMVGRDLSQFYQRHAHAPGPVVLEVEALRTSAHPRHPLTFRVHAGEIVGVAGLVGAGRTELLQALFGIDAPVGGVVRLKGQALAARSPAAAIRAGVALVPEDRKQQGLVLEMSVRENATLPSLRFEQRLGFVGQASERATCRKVIEELRVKTPGPEQPVQFLSGGNQQKVVLGKWLARDPSLLLLDEPTRGVDVGAKQEIYRLMEDLAGRGMAILFVSSEMEEILRMSDRVLVMHEGRLGGELSRAELSEEAVMHLATGRKHSGPVSPEVIL